MKLIDNGKSHVSLSEGCGARDILGHAGERGRFGRKDALLLFLKPARAMSCT